MRNTISNQIIKEENALSSLKEADLISCQFVPEADDEACLRMAKDVMIRDCSFSVRYALWAAENFILEKAKQMRTADPLSGILSISSLRIVTGMGLRHFGNVVMYRFVTAA